MTQFYNGEDKILVAVDSIILGFKEGKLKLLIGKRTVDPGAGMWSLYGGFVRKDEDLEDAAHRVLHQYTGIRNIYMQQVGTFGKVHRDPGDRVISVAYCALINVDDYDTSLLDKYGLIWADVDNLPEMWGDHKEMVDKALSRLRQHISTQPLSFNLLPNLFTLTQLQSVYEAIIGSEVDKRNFRKKIKQMDFIEQTDLIDKTTSKRGAHLYRFNKRIYEKNELHKFKL